MDRDYIEKVEENTHLLAKISENAPDEVFSISRALRLIAAVRFRSPSGAVNQDIILDEAKRCRTQYKRVLRKATGAPDYRTSILKQKAVLLQGDLMMLEALAG
jgi:hypothetical protein